MMVLERHIDERKHKTLTKNIDAIKAKLKQSYMRI